MTKPAWRGLLLGLLITAAPAWAQSYPDKSRPLKLVVPFGTASSSDMLARALGRGINEVSGMTVVVENKPGAEGVIGVQAVKSASPDGYTLLLTSSSTQVLNPHMIPQLPYDPVADFMPLTGVSKSWQVLNAGPSVQFKTAREFIAAARANPGKYSFGSGTATSRLSGELLQRLANVTLLLVPYKSTAEALTGLASGQVDVVFADVPSSAPHYQTGRARALAITNATRAAALPNVPTLREEGVAEYEITAWFATYFPSKTPPEIAATMRDILRKALQTKVVTDVFATFALEPLEASGEQLTTLQRSESDKWGRLVRAANLAPR